MNCQREQWHNSYIEELKELYYIMINILHAHYPKIDLDDEVSFHNFSRMVYHCSSKYISPYTKANCSLKLDKQI